jgi:hypothetical protein
MAVAANDLLNARSSSLELREASRRAEHWENPKHKGKTIGRNPVRRPAHQPFLGKKPASGEWPNRKLRVLHTQQLVKL